MVRRLLGVAVVLTVLVSFFTGSQYALADPTEENQTVKLTAGNQVKIGGLECHWWYWPNDGTEACDASGWDPTDTRYSVDYDTPKGNQVRLRVEFQWHAASSSQSTDYYSVWIRAYSKPNPDDGQWVNWCCGGALNKATQTVEVDINPRYQAQIFEDYSVPWKYIVWDKVTTVHVTEEFSLNVGAEVGAQVDLGFGTTVYTKGTIDAGYKVKWEYDVDLYKWDIDPSIGIEKWKWKLGVLHDNGKRQAAIAEYLLVFKIKPGHTLHIETLDLYGDFDHWWKDELGRIRLTNIYLNSHASPQNDAGQGTDAGNGLSTAMGISPGTFKGALFGVDGSAGFQDDYDYYKHDATAGKEIRFTMTPNADSDFDLDLYDPSGTVVQSSWKGGSATDRVVLKVSSTGDWTTRVGRWTGEGFYDFVLKIWNPISWSGTPSATQTSVSLSWTQYDNADGDFSKYTVYYKKSSVSSWTAGPEKTVVSDTSATASGLSCGTWYNFKVRLTYTDLRYYETNVLTKSTSSCDDGGGGGGGGGGGSPFVAPWNGSAYQDDNNILPLSDVYDREALDVVDYYRLNVPIVPLDGKYSLKLVEFEEEHSYIDSAALWTVDHDEDGRIYVHPKTGEVFTYEAPEPPYSAVNNYGQDVLDLLQAWDGSYYEAWRGDAVELNFGNVNGVPARLVIVADIPLPKTRIYVNVWNGTDWVLAETMHHRINFAEDVVDLSSFTPDSGDPRVQLVAASRLALDQVGLDTSPPKPFTVQTPDLLSAVHSSGQDVIDLLASIDSSYAEIVPGQEILLEFDIPALQNPDTHRSLILVSHGHYQHKYQSYIGDDLEIAGLHVQVSSVLAQSTEVYFWEVNITSISWQMGDGNVLTGMDVSHTYKQPGKYTLLIEVSYEDERSLLFERRISVEG